jgi:hypothetical protein
MNAGAIYPKQGFRPLLARLERQLSFPLRFLLPIKFALLISIGKFNPEHPVYSFRCEGYLIFIVIC